MAQALLKLTLASIAAQTAPDVSVIIAGHDRPALPDDPRVTFLPVDWPVEPPGPHNDDSGRKKHLLSEFILQRGGGLMMIVDADDWVDRETVAVARREIVGETVGGLITSGDVLDLESGRVATLPHPAVFGDFHRICGTSTITRLQPTARDPARRDPFSVLRSHHLWLERAAEFGLTIARLPVRAAYLIGTSINHSDVHGPHGAWRASFRDAVNAVGASLDAATAARYGLTLEAVRTAGQAMTGT